MNHFKDLHYQDQPLLLCNVWDVPSVKTAERLNYQAVGTSSAAIAQMLGYQDGENMPFADLLFIVKKVAANTSLPISVDIESGYSRAPKEIAAHIRELASFGVVGINIEDTVVGQKREFLEAESFAEMLSEVKNYLQNEGLSIFFNVRTDAFLLGVSNPLEEALKRIALYESAGADGVFVPCIEKPEDINIVVNTTSVPVNVMCIPNLPDFEQLKSLGVKRVSMGNFVHHNTNSTLEYHLQLTQEQQSFQSLFE